MAYPVTLHSRFYLTNRRHITQYRPTNFALTRDMHSIRPIQIITRYISPIASHPVHPTRLHLATHRALPHGP